MDAYECVVSVRSLADRIRPRKGVAVEFLHQSMHFSWRVINWRITVQLLSAKVERVVFVPLVLPLGQRVLLFPSGGKNRIGVL